MIGRDHTKRPTRYRRLLPINDSTGHKPYYIVNTQSAYGKEFHIFTFILKFLTILKFSNFEKTDFENFLNSNAGKKIYKVNLV